MPPLWRPAARPEPRLDASTALGLLCIAASLLLFAVVMSGCGADPEPWSQWQAGLKAYCQVNVAGRGMVDMEEDYLPHVVNCENGAADLEALKAQAVAARSYAYYKLETSGSIGDGTGDQVYSCGREPGPQHYEAVRATSGQVLTYAGSVIAAFYVAGARQSGPTCRGGTDDPTNTERFVTYNEGRSGDDIEQTTLGFVDPANTRNRGCKSQNGAHCLAGEGWLYPDILRFYYGEDIGLETAQGACVTPETPPPPPPMTDDGGEPPPPLDGGAPVDAPTPGADASSPPPPPPPGGGSVPPPPSGNPFPNGVPGQHGDGPSGSVGGCAISPAAAAASSPKAGAAWLAALLLAAVALASRGRG